MKKLMYIHGAFSAFKPDSPKVVALSKEFDVCGTNYDMEKSYQDNVKMLRDFAVKECVDFIVGTSLGGLYAAEVSLSLSIPGILINPSVEPYSTLPRYIGEHTNFVTGNSIHFTKELAESFPKNIPLYNHHLTFLGMKDDLIDAERTRQLIIKNNCEYVADDNADHRWESFNFNEKIESFVS
jgi:predicted esterase YcpF (UPF0227 family)